MPACKIAGQKPTGCPPGAKQVTDRAFSILVEDGVFTKAEKLEIVKSIDYRNKAAHQVESLMDDLGRHVSEEPSAEVSTIDMKL